MEVEQNYYWTAKWCPEQRGSGFFGFCLDGYTFMQVALHSGFVLSTTPTVNHCRRESKTANQISKELAGPLLLCIARSVYCFLNYQMFRGYHLCQHLQREI